MNTKEILKAILSKSMTIEQAFASTTTEGKLELEYVLAGVQESLIKGCDTYKADSYFETFKTDSSGQWKIEKAIKPGPPLDYAKINPRANASVSPQAKVNADTAAATTEAAAPSINYQNNRMKAPKAYAGAAERARQTREKITQQMSEPAVDTIINRQKAKKSEGNESQNATAFAMSEQEPHMDDPKHEAKEKKKAKKIKDNAQELLDMHKEVQR